MKKVDEELLRKVFDEAPQIVFILYNIEDIAKLLNVSIHTVRYWIKTKQLKAAKLGKSWRVEHNDLVDFLNSRKNVKESDANGQ
jgi:excisionase family DNA binding protein